VRHAYWSRFTTVNPAGSFAAQAPIGERRREPSQPLGIVSLRDLAVRPDSEGLAGEVVECVSELVEPKR
jgi:hypothetical protein